MSLYLLVYHVCLPDPSFRTQAFDDAGAAQTSTQTYDAIRLALGRIGDHHSSFRPPEASASPSPAPPAATDPVADLLDTDLGFLEVPAFSGQGAEANQLATQHHRLIEGVDTLGTCGWIVDLRGNTGGNMWPMIAGVGPILGEGTIGFFVDPDSVVISWFYEAGSSGVGTSTIVSATDAYVLESPDPPVAVLYDDRTASSGEATAISFRGRPDARSFGAPTSGLSTANRSYTLSDGAMIILTVSTMADRTGRLYGEKVIPDEVVEGGKTKAPLTDVPLRTAMKWLRVQPACVA